MPWPEEALGGRVDGFSKLIGPVLFWIFEKVACDLRVPVVPVGEGVVFSSVALLAVDVRGQAELDAGQLTVSSTLERGILS